MKTTEKIEYYQRKELFSRLKEEIEENIKLKEEIKQLKERLKVYINIIYEKYKRS